MKVYRASRKPRTRFDPLDSSASIVRDGWRFNDKRSEILYAAEIQSLALLEVVVRPGWVTVDQVTVATLEIPDESIVDLETLEISLPTNWNARPAARDAQGIGGNFLAASAAHRGNPSICGVRVPSVISTTDCNVLLNPKYKDRYRVIDWAVIPFQTLKSTAT